MWRNHKTHAEETKAVRQALRAAEINARVSHGRGTAWAWLEINIGAGQQWGEHVPVTDGQLGSQPSCQRCARLLECRKRALAVALEVTGRHGDYDGKIQILTQDYWNARTGRNEPINTTWPRQRKKKPS